MKYFEEGFCRKLRDMFDQHNPAPSHKLHYNLYARSTMMMMMRRRTRRRLSTMMMRRRRGGGGGFIYKCSLFNGRFLYHISLLVMRSEQTLGLA